MGKYEHIQQSPMQANMQLPKLGLVVFTFGNVSAVDRCSWCVCDQTKWCAVRRPFT